MSNFTNSLTQALVQLEPYPSQDSVDLKTKLQTVAHFLPVEERNLLLRALNLGDVQPVANMTAELSVDEAFDKLRDISEKETTFNQDTPGFYAAIFAMQMAFAYQYPSNTKNNEGAYLDDITAEELTLGNRMMLSGKSRQLYLRATLDRYFATPNAYRRRHNILTGDDYATAAKTPDGIELSEREILYLRSQGVVINLERVTAVNHLLGRIISGADLLNPWGTHAHVTRPSFVVNNLRIQPCFKAGVAAASWCMLLALFISIPITTLLVVMVNSGLKRFPFNSVTFGCAALNILGVLAVGLVVVPLTGALVSLALISATTASIAAQASVLFMNVVAPLLLFAKGLYNQSRQNGGRSVVDQFGLVTDICLRTFGASGAAIQLVALAVVDRVGAAYQAAPPLQMNWMGTTARIAHRVGVVLRIVDEPDVDDELASENELSSDDEPEVEVRQGLRLGLGGN